MNQPFVCVLTADLLSTRLVTVVTIADSESAVQALSKGTILHEGPAIFADHPLAAR